MPPTDTARFHLLNPEYGNRSLVKAVKRGDLTEEDSHLIADYVAEKKITAGISNIRAAKIQSNLVTVRRFIGPFTSNQISDIYSGVANMADATSARGTPFSANTKADLIQAMKSFYFWLLDNGLVNLPERKLKSIKIPTKEATKTASDLLTSKEIEAIASVCTSPRDKALILTLYEGGFRIGEVGNMRWGDLSFDNGGVIVNVTFKTNKPRYIRLVMASEALIKLKSFYPGHITDDSYVFLLENGKDPLTYPSITKQIRRLADRAGITKHVTPHIFRHSRITHLIQQGVNESVIKLMMWGTIESKMFANYAHLTGCDVDREIYKLYGIDTSTVQVSTEQLTPKLCPRCREINGPTSTYCHMCGQSLDGALKTEDQFQSWILEHSDELIEFLRMKSGEKTEALRGT